MIDEDGKVEVVVYSDAPLVKLYLNGEEVGTAILAHGNPHSFACQCSPAYLTLVIGRQPSVSFAAVEAKRMQPAMLPMGIIRLRMAVTWIQRQNLPKHFYVSVFAGIPAVKSFFD